MDRSIYELRDRSAAQMTPEQKAARPGEIALEQVIEQTLVATEPGALRDRDLRHSQQLRACNRCVSLANESERLADRDATVSALGSKGSELAGIDPPLE